MTFVRRLTLPVFLLCALGCLPRAHIVRDEPDVQVFDVPPLAGVNVDGDPGDWGDRGFRVDVLFDPAARPKPVVNFDAAARLGWDGRGLLVLVMVTDDVPVEHDKGDALWRRDSIELFVAARHGAEDRWQAVVAPGLDPKHPELRAHLYDYRKSEELKKAKLTATAARTRTTAGYVLEVLLPWANLGIEPILGREVAFQVYANDADNVHETSQLRWFPEPGAHANSKRMHRLRLSGKAGPAVTASASGWYERFRRTRINVAATAESAGRAAQVLGAGKLLGRGGLVRDGRLARASVVLPMPARGKAYGPLSAVIEGRPVATVELPDADAERKRAFERAEMNFRPCVFSGEKFPPVEFEQPSFVEDLIGPYTLKTTFYDADYNEVAAAKKPGRYGAIVEIKPEDGPAINRFFTLFRQPEDMKWWQLKLPLRLELPKQLGIDPAVVREHSETLADYVKGEIRSSFDRNSQSAVVFAGLYETKPGTRPTERTGPWARNNWWWHELKRKTGDLIPLRYLVHVPPAAEKDKAKRWPTILFLHGAGERGDDLELVKKHGPPKIVQTRKDFPFIVISPQCPRGTWWSMPALNDLLDEVAARYPIDPDRIYLTGLSMGGFGSWALATEYPKRFAAVVPICGGGDRRDVERLKDVPIWVFHGGKDGVVPVERTEEMVEALREVHGRVRFTVYPDAGHDSWTKTYDDEELYEWLLRQRRGRAQQPRAKIRGAKPSD